MEFLWALLRHGMVPSLVTYSSLICACEARLQVGRAVQLFEAMPWQGVVPDVVIYTVLMNAFEKGK